MGRKARGMAYLYVALAILFWGSSATVAKLLLGSMDVLQVMLFATLFATICLSAAVTLLGRWPTVRRYGPRDYLNFALTGFLGVFIYYLLLYEAYQITSVPEAYIVNYTYPLWMIAFAAPLLGEPVTARKTLAIIFGVLGVFIVVAQGYPAGFSAGHILGDVMALAGAVCYGLFSVVVKRQDYEKFTSMLFCFLFAFVFALVSVLAFSNVPSINRYQLAGLLWQGVFPWALAYVLWFLALQRGDTGVMSNLVLLTPFVSLVCIFLVLGEPITQFTISGLVLIVVGIALQERGRRPTPPRSAVHA